MSPQGFLVSLGAHVSCPDRAAESGYTLFVVEQADGLEVGHLLVPAGVHGQMGWLLVPAGVHGQMGWRTGGRQRSCRHWCDMAKGDTWLDRDHGTARPGGHVRVVPVCKMMRVHQKGRWRGWSSGWCMPGFGVGVQEL